MRLRPERPNQVWSYDFLSARTQEGRTLRLLSLLDEYRRECLAIRVEAKAPAVDQRHRVIHRHRTKPDNSPPAAMSAS